jgi:hypothetical protein
MNRIEFVVAAFLVGANLLVWVALYVMVLARVSHRRRLDVAAAGVAEPIRQALVEFLAGNKDLSRLRELVRDYRQTVGDVFMEFQGKLAGSALDLAGELALELALLHDWCAQLKSGSPALRRAACSRLAFICAYEPCRRVAGDLLEAAAGDADPGVRLCAERGLVQPGEMEAIGKVFRLAVSENLLARVLLTEDLRRYALELCQQAVPEVLDSAKPLDIRAALEMLAAWERAVWLPGLHLLLDHANRDIRIAALRLAPFVTATDEIRSSVLRALTDADDEIGTAAALASGRLKLQAGLPSLARLVRTGSAEVARSAAAALAEMPARGWQTLEELAGRPDSSSAYIAAEALVHAQRRAGG